MYNIMLTDDEQIVIDSLKFIIEKNFPGQTQLFEAQTGGDAVNICRANKIEIAFIDINMPGLNGLEAIKEIKQFNPQILIIILSAFDRFQYAREALELGVYKYLTKPVNRNVIAQTVRTAMGIVDSQRGKLSSDIELREKLNSVSSIVESDFIYSSIFAADGQRDLTPYLEFFNITSRSFFFCTIEIPHISAQNRYDIYMQVRDVLTSTSECIIGPLMMNRIVVYFPFSESDDKVQDMSRAETSIHNIYSQLAMRVGSDIRIGVSPVEQDTSKTIAIYNNSLAALNAGSGSGVFLASTDKDSTNSASVVVANYGQKLLARVQSGDIQAIHHIFTSYSASLFEVFRGDNDYVKNRLFILLVLARNIAHEAKKSYPGNDGHPDTFKVLSELKTQQELEQYVLSNITECAQIVCESRVSKTNPVIDKAYNYINKNLAEQLSLEQTAAQVNVSPYYLSKLFKEETGENFIDYVTNLRIKKAKELLKDGSMNVKEISHETGYVDQNYFSKIFKKNTGYTPTEFRDSVLSGGIL